MAMMLESRLAVDASESPSSGGEREDLKLVTLEKVHHSKTDVESIIGADVTYVLQTERDIVTHVLSVYDDPSLNPWTFRSFFIVLGLSAFGGVLGKR